MSDSIAKFLASRVEEEARLALTAATPNLRSAHDALQEAFRSQLKLIQDGQLPTKAVIAEFEARELSPPVRR